MTIAILGCSQRSRQRRSVVLGNCLISQRTGRTMLANMLTDFAGKSADGWLNSLVKSVRHGRSSYRTKRTGPNNVFSADNTPNGEADTVHRLRNTGRRVKINR